MIAGYQDFEFDLPGVLLARLIEVLDGMLPAPLDSDRLNSVPESQGVYQIFLDDQHSDLVTTSVSLAAGLATTSRSIVAAVVPQLPPGWQAIQFPSHIILYKNSIHYEHGKIIVHS
jgi:hypothetical protein